MQAPASSKPSSEVVARRGMPRMLGRYELLGALARGGMATVYLARHRGEAGFQRLFAIKVLHDHLSDDEEFIAMLLDEARIAARLHHPNVVPILDLGTQDGLHYVVMEYIEGCSLAVLLKKFRDQRPPRLLVPIVLDVLAGLHAAHTLKDDDDQPMNLVHRDVSPQNVMVGVDGTARITDFGIARAESRIMSTRPGQLKGKLAFMAPEQVRGSERVDCRADLFSTGAMLWSALTGRRLFLADSDAATLSNILQMAVPPPSTIGCKPPVGLDPIFERALERDPAKRFQNAQEMEEAVREAAIGAACLGSRREVAAWVHAGFGEELEERRKAIKAAVDVQRSSRESVLSVSSGMMPSVGSFTPSHTTSQVPAHVEAPTPHSITAPSQAPTAVHPAIQRRKNRLWIALGGLGVGVVAIAIVILLATRGSAPAAVAQPLPAETAAPAPTPVVTEAPKLPEPEPAPPAATAERTDEPEPAPRERSVSRWSAPARRSSKSEPATKVAPDPTPPPAPTPTAPKKALPRWDKDSPGLPPE